METATLKLQAAFDKVFTHDSSFPLRISYDGAESGTIEFIKESCCEVKPILEYILENMDDGFPLSTTTFSQVIQILEDISLELKNIFFGSFCREFIIVIKMLEKLITPATNLKDYIDKSSSMNILKKSEKPEILSSPEAEESLKVSFSRSLSSVGQKVLQDLEITLLERCGNGNWTSYLAPIVSLCQSSGAGKSKMSVELLKRRPGHYIVFREKDQTGYPKANATSELLYDLISSYSDSKNDLTNIPWDKCTVGKVLNLFAIIVIQYYMEFVAQYKKFKNMNQTTHHLASKFDTNEIPVSYDQEDFNDLYCKLLKIEKSDSLTVKNISDVIMFVINDPKILFTSNDIKSTTKIGLNWSYFQKYPFVFVIDEAEILAKLLFPKETLNGFEAFRRAMSYLQPSTRIIVLTLGTKSDVIDLNPPVIDNSFRLQKRIKLPIPIILRGNMNIFAEDIRIKNITLKYEYLRNPLNFLYLCTVGHSIWSSIPPNTVVDVAKKKLLNGTASEFFHVPVLWMILTGLAANPFSINATKYVANHMGYLVQLSEDLKKLIVMYPSEPILAIAANILLDELDSDTIFRILNEKFESIEIDRGHMAEIFGSFIMLRCAWASDLIDSARNLKFDESFLKELQNLRSIKDPIPTSTPNSSLPSASSAESLNIPPQIHTYDYRTHTVGFFIQKIIQSTGVSVASLGLPQETLEGLINFNHFVPLCRDFSEDLVAHVPPSNVFGIGSNILPMADYRINDKSRNILSKDLLKLCLLNFAGIHCPRGMYGFDVLIPVLLKAKITPKTAEKDDDVTFLGVQIKRSNAATGYDIQKMQARFHMIKCTNDKCKGKGKGKCDQCIQPASLSKIFKNQITILISLDEEGTYDNFQDCETFFPGCKFEDRKFFKEILKTGKISTYPLEGESSRTSSRAKKSPSKSSSFMIPLVQVGKAHANNLLVSSALWKDEFVDFGKAFSDKEISITPDTFTHRQFTICTRGWKIFRNVLGGGKSSSFGYEKIANDLMNQSTLSRHIFEEKTPSMARAIVNDLSPIFIFSSDQIGFMMGKPSNLASLDSHIANTHEKLVEHMARNISTRIPSRKSKSDSDATGASSKKSKKK